MALRDLTFEQRQARDAYRKQVRESRAPKAERVEKLAGPAAEEIQIGPRKAPSLAQKTRVHAAHEGCCHVCGAKLPITGPEVQYDHVIERIFTGRDDDDALAPICTTPCHARKSARRMAEIAKVNRLIRKRKGEKKPKRPIPSAGWSGDYAPMPRSRGFGPPLKDR